MYCLIWQQQQQHTAPLCLFFSANTFWIYARRWISYLCLLCSQEVGFFISPALLRITSYLPISPDAAAETTGAAGWHKHTQRESQRGPTRGEAGSVWWRREGVQREAKLKISVMLGLLRRLNGHLWSCTDRLAWLPPPVSSSIKTSFSLFGSVSPSHTFNLKTVL